MSEIPVYGMLCRCRKCGRWILVERAINGSDHDMGIYTSCWECCTDDQKKYATEKYHLEKICEGK